MPYTLIEDDDAPSQSSAGPAYELIDEPAATEPSVAQVPEEPAYQAKLNSLKRGAAIAARGAALTARAAGMGLAGLGDMIAMGAPGATMRPPWAQAPSLRARIDEIASTLGVKPETSGEKLYSAGVEGAAGSVIPGGGTLAMLAQAGGGALGGVASQAVENAGGGTGAQITAGMLASMTPSSLSKLMQASVRGALRGGEDGLRNLRDMYEKYVSAGVIPSALMAADNRRSNWLDSVLSYMIGSGGVMSKDKKRVLNEIRDRLEKNISDFSQTGSPEEVGRKILSGVNDEGGFRDTFKKTTRELNDKLDSQLGENFRVGLDDTTNTLAGMNADMPGAPAISQLWKNGEIINIENAIKSDLTSAEAVLSRPDIDEATKAVIREGLDAKNGVGQVDRLGEAQSVLEKRLAEMDAANSKAGLFDKNRRRMLNEMRGMKGSSSEAQLADLDRAEEAALQARASTIQQLENVRTVRASKMSAEELESILNQFRDGKVPIKAVQRLRTLIGENIENQIFMSTVPRSRWRALYAAVSNDLETAIKGSDSPQAISYFEDAQKHYREGMRHLEEIAPVVDRFTNGGGAEGVYTATVSGLRDGASTLRAILGALPKDSQKFLVASFVRRMGTAPANEQNIAAGVFSPERYLSTYAGLAPEAKKALFNNYGPQWQQDMDKIAWVADKLRARGQEFHTPEAVVQQSLGAGKLTQLLIATLTFAPKAFVTGLSGVVAPYTVARWMMNPKFVHFLAETTKMPTSGLPGALAVLRKEAEESKDKDLKEAEAFLRVKTGLANSRGPKTRRRSSIPELSALQASQAAASE